MFSHPVVSILLKWPSRQAVFDDARVADPSLQMVAVHRWFQRSSVPARFWGALLDGAVRRGFDLTSDEIVRAHAAEQKGDAA